MNDATAAAETEATAPKTREQEELDSLPVRVIVSVVDMPVVHMVCPDCKTLYSSHDVRAVLAVSCRGGCLPVKVCACGRKLIGYRPLAPLALVAR